MAGKPIKVRYQSLVIIWLSLLISQVMFLVVIYFSRPELFDLSSKGPVLGQQPLITFVFAIAAIAFFVLSQVLSGQHMRRAITDHDQSCVQTGLVLGCALSEVCSLLGVILAFVWEYQYFFFWLLIGTVGILLNFPRKSDLDAASEQKVQ